jgi:predicted acyltransferase
MFLLVAEFAHLFPWLVAPEVEGTWLQSLGQQLHHCEWEGLHFWDLIQPFFMFIVGVAMPMSFAKRKAKGSLDSDILKHVVKRSILLLVLGWALYCIDPGRIVLRFDNVLAQLSITYLLAYLVMKRPVWFQISFSIILLLINEALYRFFAVEGFNQAFVPGENFNLI